jgi:hypothetical protein
MSESDELIERVSAELRAPVRVSAEFDERVMTSVRARPRTSLLGTFSRWLVRPRPLQLSPLGALAAAAVVLAVVMAGTWQLARQNAATAPMHERFAAEAAEGVRVVQFVFVAPGASRVTLVGDFNGWDTDATPMQKGAPGIWSVSLPLPVGRHHYAFVVDDEQWAADPAAPQAVADDFGTPSSVVTVAMRSGA